jgi:MerR family transcriptional regulator, light-induced transcriptional regulator
MSNPDPSNAPVNGHLSISEVARETGVQKDTLRVWERRYGFPRPERNAAGERLYPAEQVQRLGLIKRLLDVGLRPGGVVALSLPELELHIREAAPRSNGSARSATQATVAVAEALAVHPAGRADANGASAPDLERWMEWVRTGSAEPLHQALNQYALKHGLLQTVDGLLGPLGCAVGQAWWTGDITVAQEHLYTEAVHRFLHDALQKAQQAGQRLAPKVLLTTLPGEQHTLGLLMAECVLALEGCARYALGRDTPLPEVVNAANHWAIDVVALSVSGNAAASEVWGGLSMLRQALPAHVAIWVGGGSPHLLRSGMPAGVEVMQSVHSVAGQVQAWRQSHPGGGHPA